MLPANDEAAVEPGDLCIELCGQGSAVHDDGIALFELGPDSLSVILRTGTRLRVPTVLRPTSGADTVSSIRVLFQATAEVWEDVRSFLRRTERYGAAFRESA